MTANWSLAAGGEGVPARPGREKTFRDRMFGVIKPKAFVKDEVKVGGASS